ncbi:MAG: NADPH-dependent F420 reductase [Halobacteriaceae archaeon]
MRIALLGGTGDIGRGLALRLGYHTEHDVIVGSRDADRAAEKTAAYEAELDEHGVERTLESGTNAEAAAEAGVVVVAVPPYYVRETVDAVADGLDEATVLVTPAVGMERTEDGFHYDPPSIGSLTELVAATAPESTPVVGAFHNLAAGRLAALDATLDVDCPIVANDATAKRTVSELTAEIPGIRPLDAGPLANAAEVESVTALLVTLARHNEGLHDLGVKFT